MTRFTEQEYANFIGRGRRAQKAAGQILEKAWQAQVEQLADLFGWKHYHTFDSRRSEEDFPDLVMARRHPGKKVVLVDPGAGYATEQTTNFTRLIAAELKREGENPTPGQQDWLDFFKEIGAETYVWRPSDLETVKKVLR